MYSAIKKRTNECFIGAFQFLYYKLYKKYIPDKIIKEIFNFSTMGVSLKSIKSGLNKIGWKGKIFLAQPKEIPLNKWFIILTENEIGLHYKVIKRLKHGFACFDPSIGEIKNYKPKAELVFIEINNTEKIKFEKIFDFRNSQVDSVKLIALNITEVVLAFIMSVYFKYALYGVENKSYVFVKKMVLFFALIGSINIFLSYIKNIYINKKIWQKIKELYEVFFGYLLDQNIRVKNHFTKMHIYESLQQGVDFLQFSLVDKTYFINSFMISSAAILILYLQFKLIIVPITAIFIISSILTVAFRDKIFKHGEKIRSSEISVANCFLKFYDNWETSIGFEKESYKELLENSLNKNIFLNYRGSKYSSWINFSFGFIAYIFNILISAYIFIWMIQDQVSIANGIYIVTISTMLYSNLVKVWSYIFNYKIEYDAYNKFLDFASTYNEVDSQMSYDGKRYYKNDLEGIQGHFQIKGINGCGKSTYLKMYCGLFSRVVNSRIYLNSTSSVLKKPEDKTFKKFNLENFNLNQELVSDGQRQIRNVLLALEEDFQALVLDEAMSSVKIKLRKNIYEKIIKFYPKRTILIVDHEIDIKVEDIEIVL